MESSSWSWLSYTCKMALKWPFVDGTGEETAHSLFMSQLWVSMIVLVGRWSWTGFWHWGNLISAQSLFRSQGDRASRHSSWETELWVDMRVLVGRWSWEVHFWWHRGSLYSFNFQVFGKQSFEQFPLETELWVNMVVLVARWSW